MFYDKAKIYVRGGDGGNGCVAMRREKYVPDGGPWGGDGGRGGDILLVADEGLRTLVDFRYKTHYKAQRGQHGMGKNMQGASGEDLVLRLPAGTVVRDSATDKLIGDLTTHGQVLVAARGGRGGRGNARFATHFNRAPKMAEKGEPGEEVWLALELKLLADVGLVGFPNAGKSTLIARVSAARPKIADYPFTTLEPNLGVVKVEEGRSFVLADIPGLIEGAHSGAGLGHEFLRHVDRTRVLVHVVDISGVSGRDPAGDFKAINHELSMYRAELLQKPMVVVANKIDMPGSGENLSAFRDAIGRGYELFPVSALTGEGLGPLVIRLADLVESLPPVQEADRESREEERTHIAAPRFTVSREEASGVFIVAGREIERHVAMTDLENEEALSRLQRIMTIMGIDGALREKGARNGDTVRIGKFEFEYVEA